MKEKDSPLRLPLRGQSSSSLTLRSVLRRSRLLFLGAKQYGVAVFSVSAIDAELVDELRDLLGMLLGAAALRRELASRPAS